MNIFISQVFSLTKAQLKSRYRKTIAGFLWVVINPILTFFVQALIFKVVLKINIPNYLQFLVGGILPWVFISTTLNMTTNCFVSSGELIKSFKIHPLILPCASLLDNIINFIASFLLVYIYLIITQGMPLVGGLLLFLPMIILWVQLYLVTIILSTFQVFYRDVLHLVQFFLSIMMFLTPIFYHPSNIPEKYQWLVDVNLIYYFIRPFQICLWKFDLNEFFFAEIQSIAIVLATLIITIIVWNQKRDKIFHYV